MATPERLRLFTPGPEDEPDANGDTTSCLILQPEASDNPTVAWVIDLYLDFDRRATEARTHAERRRVLGLLREEYGHRALDLCKPAHVELWFAAHPEWQSAWTQQRINATVQRPFNWAAKLGLIPRNPFWGVSRRPGEPGRAMEEWEFRRLLRRTDALFRRVLLFLRLTGCRPGEMSRLEWSHVDTEHGVIVLHQHKTRKTQRQPRPRVIVLHPILIKLLLWLRRHQRAGQPYLFLNSRGQAWTRNSLTLRVAKLRKRCALGADCRLYGLRHGFATRAVENGVELKTLAELLGHTTTRMTEHYVHLAGRTKHLHEAVLRAVGDRGE